MNRFLSLFLFSILSFACSIGHAQMGMEEDDATKYMSNKPITIVPEERNFSGSAYENEEFVNGFVFNDGKILASNVALRYNAKRDELEVKKSLATSDASAKVLVKKSDIYVKMLNKSFVYCPVKQGIEKAGYFMVLHEGDNYGLYKKITKKFLEGKESVNSITRDTPPSFKTEEAYYLVDMESESFTLFPKSRKGKLKTFPNFKKEVKDYVKKEGLNINKDYALKKLVKYYDSL